MFDKFFSNYKSLFIFLGLFSVSSFVTAETFNWYGTNDERSNISLKDGDLYPDSFNKNVLNVYADVPEGSVYGGYLNNNVSSSSENEVNVVNSTIGNENGLVYGGYITCLEEISEKLAALKNSVNIA